MREISKEDLTKILQKHGAWLRGVPGGERANLSGADLSRANLSGADLSGADLSDADLSRANLSDANLSRANLSRANLSDADLSDADLSRANLSDVKEDLIEVLESVPSEVPGLLLALTEGRIDGSTYSGDCACLVGTLAHVRHCNYTDIPGLAPDSGRPAERWFLAIQPGHTPENNTIAAITAGWIKDWIAARA